MLELFPGLVGGKGYFTRIGLGAYEPKWRGKREYLTALGGEKSQSDLPETVGKKIIGYVLEVAVVVAMNTHLYEFDGRIY